MGRGTPGAPRKQPAVHRTEFQGVSRSEAYTGIAYGGVLLGSQYAKRAHLERGDTLRLVGPAASRDAKVVGIIDAVGPMAGMEMRMSLGTMRQVYGYYPPAQLAVVARSPGQRRALESKIGAV